MEKRLFTSECVTCGHPDKVADSISDAILDACLAQDPGSRVACETMVTTDFCVICGEITTKAVVDYASVAREVIRKIGYTREGEGFCADSVEILCKIHTQSADIALGTNDEVGGAGDQGMMFGGACTQTPELMPLPIALSRALSNRLTEAKHEKDFIRPDGKTQVSVEFDENGKVLGIDTVVVSVMHSADITLKALRTYIKKEIIAPVLKKYGFAISDVANIHINPTGNFVIGGPNGDTGLTGRKIIVDTYGGYFSHGGGAFSGKDPTKVDRSGAYMARYMAKNLVAAGLAEQVQVQLAYAIGVAEPVSVRVDSYGTGKIADEEMTALLRKNCDLTPAGIIRKLQLRNPIYGKTALEGHFGVEDLPWEQTDLADTLQEQAKDVAKDAYFAVLQNFRLDAEAVSCEPYGCGHINGSFLVTTASGRRYILQRVNDHTFKDVEGLMENITAITDFLWKKAEDPRSVMTVVQTRGGESFLYTQASYWRVVDFIEGTICLQAPETDEDFYQSAIAFGRFQQLLEDFPAEQLHETIPNFHNTPDRYRIFLETVEKDPMHRAAKVRQEIEFALERQEEMSILQNALSAGELPLRVTHNDTKLNNVLLDEKSREALCVIDLDTVMPGSSLYDFGDAIRFGAATAAEDETDLSKMELDLNLFRVFVRGYVQACPGLTQKEKEYLALGAKTLTMECGIRFLTDYLDGDNYFAIHREGHNLDRARTQFKLVADMEEKWDEMLKIIAEETK